VFDSRKRERGLDWPQQAMTMIGRTRLRSLRDCCESVLGDGIPGDFVETGIWRGGACIMTAAVLAAYGDTELEVRGCGSSQGLPPPNEEEYPGDRGDQLYRFPQLAALLLKVCRFLRELGVFCGEYEFCLLLNPPLCSLVARVGRRVQQVRDVCRAEFLMNSSFTSLPSVQRFPLDYASICLAVIVAQILYGRGLIKFARRR
jgi:hypothetical protein